MTDSAAAAVSIEEPPPEPTPEPTSSPEPPGGDEDPEPDDGLGPAEGAWQLFDVLPNPQAGELSSGTARASSSCSLGDGALSIDHAKFSLGEPTVQVTFSYAYEAPPGTVPP